jgi:trk system potassium uptake protein TrkA
MFAIIVGGGRTGSYLAKSLIEDGNDVTILEKREEIAAKDEKEVPAARVIVGDGADPEQLELAGARKADLIASLTGDDEDNIVISQLSKFTFKVPRVVARVNNPKNEWLYSKKWGVDVAVSAVHIISTIIREEATLGDIVTLLKLKKGEIALVEFTISEKSQAVGTKIKDLDLPPETVLITAILREGKIVVPKGDTELNSGDEILVLTTPENEKILERKLG